MEVMLFFGTVLLFSLGLNAYYKIKSYDNEEKTVWQDGDSVRIQGKDNEARNDGFMKRIA